MPLNLSATLSAGWLPDDSTFSVLTPERPRAWAHSASSFLRNPQTSFAGEDTGQICDGDGPVACAGKAGESTCKDGKCVCAENATFVGGTCVLNSNTGLLTYMQKASAELDKLNETIEVQKAANGGDVDGSEDATAPISSVRALDLQTTMAQMKKRVEQAPKFEDLKRELEGNAATLADTAATSVEFQPSIRSLIREMGPARLEHAVQDMTRGVHGVLNTNKNLQKASVALMTTTDAQLLDGVEESINKALWPLVALRKNLKSIMGNAALLRGRDPEWAQAQQEEPNDDPARYVPIPSDELPIEKDAEETAQAAMPAPLLFMGPPLRKGDNMEVRRGRIRHQELDSFFPQLH